MERDSRWQRAGKTKDRGKVNIARQKAEEMAAKMEGGSGYGRVRRLKLSERELLTLFRLVVPLLKTIP